MCVVLLLAGLEKALCDDMRDLPRYSYVQYRQYVFCTYRQSVRKVSVQYVPVHTVPYSIVQYVRVVSTQCVATPGPTKSRMRGKQNN